MLRKLLKYDLNYMIRNMSVFYILIIFFSILTRILFSLEQTIIIGILSQISVGFLFAFVANILINTIMRSWVRFSNSIYKDEAYLTHTLPVTKNDIYNSKFIQTLIFFVIGFVIILVSLFITYYTKDRWFALKGLISNIINGLEINTLTFVMGIIGILFVEIFNAIQCGFLGIILGNRRNNNKLLFSVIFGILSYFISQGLVLFLIFIVGLFNKGIMNIFTSNIMMSIDTFKLFIFLVIIIYLLIIVFMSVVCKYMLNKGVNLE